MEIQIENIGELTRAAQLFLEHVEGHNVFAFSAEMGSGKTTFINALLKGMGVPNSEGSPTYGFVNSYSSPMYGEVNHFDMYRIDSEDEAFDLGIEEMIYSDEVCFIEWPEKIQNLLPDSTIWVYIRVNDDLSRTLSFEL